MLETLVGRLKWERIEDGIHVEIPRRFNREEFLEQLAVFLFCLLSVFSVFWIVTRFRGLHASNYVLKKTFVDWFCCNVSILIVYPIGVLTGRTALYLTPKLLKIEWRRFGFKGAQEAFTSQDLNNLRFAKSAAGAAVKNRFHANEIQFDHNHCTQYFAAGITEKEAQCLIAKMMEYITSPSRNQPEIRN